MREDPKVDELVEKVMDSYKKSPSVDKFSQRVYSVFDALPIDKKEKRENKERIINMIFDAIRGDPKQHSKYEAYKRKMKEKK